MGKPPKDLDEASKEIASLREQLAAQKAETARQREQANAIIKELKEDIADRENERKTILSDWDEQLARADKGEPLRPLKESSRVRKMPKAAMLQIGDTGPQAVLTSARDPKKDRETYKYDGSRDARPTYTETRKRLLAPVAGFLSAGLEITIVRMGGRACTCGRIWGMYDGWYPSVIWLAQVWPSEYAKTQMQLNRGNTDFKIVAHMQEKGLSIYRGLAPMLIGAPIQVSERVRTVDSSESHVVYI